MLRKVLTILRTSVKSTGCVEIDSCWYAYLVQTGHVGKKKNELLRIFVRSSLKKMMQGHNLAWVSPMEQFFDSAI